MSFLSERYYNALSWSCERPSSLPSLGVRGALRGRSVRADTEAATPRPRRGTGRGQICFYHLSKLAACTTVLHRAPELLRTVPEPRRNLPPREPGLAGTPDRTPDRDGCSRRGPPAVRPIPPEAGPDQYRAADDEGSRRHPSLLAGAPTRPTRIAGPAGTHCSCRGQQINGKYRSDPAHSQGEVGRASWQARRGRWRVNGRANTTSLLPSA